MAFREQELRLRQLWNYSSEHNVLFVHIPKNAGSSIRDELGITKSAHYPLSVLQSQMDKETFDNAIKIAVFRNPWERMVSWYRYRQQKNQDPKDIGFSIWLRDGRAQYNMEVYDSLPQIKWCTKLDSTKLHKSLDYIINFEHVNEQWEELCEIENINVKKLPKINSTGIYDYTEYYNILEDVTLVKNMFRSDIDVLDYDFGIPNNFPLLKGESEINEFQQRNQRVYYNR